MARVAKDAQVDKARSGSGVDGAANVNHRDSDCVAWEGEGWDVSILQVTMITHAKRKTHQQFDLNECA